MTKLRFVTASLAVSVLIVGCGGKSAENAGGDSTRESIQSSVSKNVLLSEAEMFDGCSDGELMLAVFSGKLDDSVADASKRESLVKEHSEMQKTFWGMAIQLASLAGLDEAQATEHFKSASSPQKDILLSMGENPNISDAVINSLLAGEKDCANVIGKGAPEVIYALKNSGGAR